MRCETTVSVPSPLCVTSLLPKIICWDWLLAMLPLLPFLSLYPLTSVFLFSPDLFDYPLPSRGSVPPFGNPYVL